MRFSSLIPFIGLAAAVQSPARRSLAERASNTTIVITPGAWQLPATWDNFISLVEGAGYETTLVPLLSVGGTERPLAGLVEDSANLQVTLETLADAGKEIVLIGHSYGGAVISSASEGFGLADRQAAGKSGGVIITAFVAAFVMSEGVSALDLLGGQPLPWMIVEDDIVVGNATLMPEVAFNDLSAADAAYYTTQTTWSSLVCFVEGNTYEPWSNGIPSAYVHTTLDGALPPAYQAGMAATLGSTVTEYSLVSGHCPFISIPDQLLTVVEDIVEVALASKA